MKPTDIRPGRTYEGRDGSRRYVHTTTRRDVFYVGPKSGRWGSVCLWRTFARWAVRGVADESHQGVAGPE